jgi:hypothetical protein
MRSLGVVQQIKRVEYSGTPPKKCQLCNDPIANIFVDGLVRVGGNRQIWADTCQSCHQLYGVGLGAGVGQEWWRDPDTGNFVKIEG